MTVPKIAVGGATVPAGEHEVKTTATDDGYVFDHVRTDSPTFAKMERDARAAGTRCCLTGTTQDVQYHHCFLEYSLAYGVDWATVKGIAIGQITQLPVLDLATHQPTVELAPVEAFKIWEIIQITKMRGYDWTQFDPDHPATFVDSRANMDPLNVRYHIGDRGRHRHTGPYAAFYDWPRLPGVVYSPNEEPSAQGQPPLGA